MSFTARFRGPCDVCDDPIEPGDQIRSTGERTYAHRWCPDEGTGPGIERPGRFDGTSIDEMGY